MPPSQSVCHQAASVARGEVGGALFTLSFEGGFSVRYSLLAEKIFICRTNDPRCGILREVIAVAANDDRSDRRRLERKPRTCRDQLDSHSNSSRVPICPVKIARPPQVEKRGNTRGADRDIDQA